MSSSSSEVKFEDLSITLEEIESAIASFNEECIGEGGFGKVYKGELSNRRGGRIVAIKQLDPDSWQGKHEFKTECSLLYSYKHKNIVTLAGYCDEDDQKIIVYEYAVNGSLDKHLRDTDKMRSIPWEQRLKICIGAAEGLKYLHYGLGTHHRVIHRDFKSANILLDENFEAKISDFGLSKIGPRNQPYSQLYTDYVGTSGYCDPHYRETAELAKESDVYAFGVVLFEMLCGRLVNPKKNCNQDHDDAKNLVYLVRHYEGSLDKIIDPHIRDKIEPKSLDTFREIAYQCLESNYKKRPQMDDVVGRLKEALDFQVISSGQEHPRTYDVFLNLSGLNVGNTFVDGLRFTLHRKGIYTSIETFESSSVAIVIFSKKYSASSHCLDQLVAIMNRHEKMKTIQPYLVLPVYYDVGPSEVRKQTGEFGEYFDKLTIPSPHHDYTNAEPALDMLSIQESIWMKALWEASSICGWDLTNIRNEEECIKEIDKSVSCKLRAINSKHIRMEPPRTYDVYLCFRASDVRTTFVADLYSTLKQNEIFAFEHHKHIDKGSSILASALEGMARSLITIVIISKGYAKSRWCLNELVVVMNRHEATKNLVLPVFYEVEASEVREQTNNFEIGTREEETAWRKALVQAANINPGLHLNRDYVWSGEEEEELTIWRIVEFVSDKLHAIKSNALA